MLGEKSTTEIHRQEESQGVLKLKVDANRGGRVAGNARKALEKELGGLDVIGFSPQELDRILADLAPECLLADEEEAPTPTVLPVTVPGDLWVLGNNLVLCGDALSSESKRRRTRVHLIGIWRRESPPPAVRSSAGYRPRSCAKPTASRYLARPSRNSTSARLQARRLNQSFALAMSDSSASHPPTR